MLRWWNQNDKSSLSILSSTRQTMIMIALLFVLSLSLSPVQALRPHATTPWQRSASLPSPSIFSSPFLLPRTSQQKRQNRQRQPFLFMNSASSSSSSSSSTTTKAPSTQQQGASSNERMQYDASKIRNFSIIAHIDHGKSTLADRLLETTKTVAQRDMEQQLLDNMDLERERGITIKLQTARVEYKAKDGETYCLNLIDTPGHVDFTYEVSRSLAACEGALLVVDASQGIEAQTLANVYLALENDLEIIPVLNKIDLPAAEPDRVADEIEQTIGLDCTDIVQASAKQGIGIIDILESIVKTVPPPAASSPEDPFRALIFDSYYDSYRGVVVCFRVVDGSVSTRDRVRFLAAGVEHEVSEIGIMQPNEVPVDRLQAGEVGYLWGNIKDVSDARVGDTITLQKQYKERQKDEGLPQIEPLPGYAASVPVVYCGLFPVDADQYESLRDALGKLRLNDAALQYEPETSGAMGFGFRCGFLGLLHMEIVQERLQREYDIDLIVTAPSVVYKVRRRDDAKGKVKEEEKEMIVDAPSKMPDLTRDYMALEPYVKMEILTPSEYNGAIIELCQDRRGILQDIKFLTPTRSTLIYELPLAEVITDFFDQLKSRTQGYASMEYSILDYRESDLVRMDVKINYEIASPLATISHRDKAQSLGRKLCASLKDKIPRQMFKIPIQACIGVKVIASESISPMRKDVLAKCYGGDISRKKKLLNKQAKGKKRMKAIGKVNVPQEAFMAVLKLDGN